MSRSFVATFDSIFCQLRLGRSVSVGPGFVRIKVRAGMLAPCYFIKIHGAGVLVVTHCAHADC
jgi:hypothetical protein